MATIEQSRAKLSSSIAELDRRRADIFETASEIALEHAKKIAASASNYDGTLALAVVVIFAKALPDAFSLEAHELIEALDSAISDRVLEEMARKRRVN